MGLTRTATGWRSLLVHHLGGYSSEEIEPYLSLMELAEPEANERFSLPAEAVLGVGLQGTGLDQAVVSPSELLHRKGEPQVLVEFRSPAYEFAKVWTKAPWANFYFVPSRVDRSDFRRHQKFLRSLLREGARANTYAAILQLIRDYVLPEESNESIVNPLLTRQMLMAVPFSVWQANEKTLTLGGSTMTNAEWAQAVIRATRDFPFSHPMRGEARRLMRNAAPEELKFVGNEVAHSGTTWAYWRIKPRMDPTNIRALLELDARYVLFTKWLLDVIQAEMIVAASSIYSIGSDEAANRWRFIEYQLLQNCENVTRIEGVDQVARAFWASIPGSPAVSFGDPWEIEYPDGLMKGLTQTLTEPLTGGIFPFGKLRGVPFMFTPEFLPHFFAHGPQKRGKTTWVGIAAAALTPWVVNITFQPASGEAGALLSYAYGPQAARDSLPSEFMEPSGTQRGAELHWKTGAHLVVDSHRKQRVLVVHFPRPKFVTSGDTVEDETLLSNAYTKAIASDVVAAVADMWLKYFGEMFPSGMLPLAVRPSPECDLTLYAAFADLLISGIKTRWSNYTRMLGSERLGKEHIVFQLTDLSMIIGKSGDNQKSVQTGQLLRGTIHALLAFGAKEWMHVFADSQALDDLKNFEAGTPGYFPVIAEIGVDETQGVVRGRHAQLWFPTKDAQGDMTPGERVDLQISDELINTFGRQAP